MNNTAPTTLEELDTALGGVWPEGWQIDRDGLGHRMEVRAPDTIWHTYESPRPIISHAILAIQKQIAPEYHIRKSPCGSENWFVFRLMLGRDRNGYPMYERVGGHPTPEAAWLAGWRLYKGVE